VTAYVPEPDLPPPNLSSGDLQPPKPIGGIADPVPPPVPQPGAEEQEPPQPPEEEQVTELTDEELGLFRQLMTVGQRSKTIDVMGHSVTIQNLRVCDEMLIGLHTKPYDDTKAAARAFQLGVCAAGIRAIDGQPLYQPLAPATDEEIFSKKVEILRDYYPVVISQIYRAIMDLDTEFVELAIKLGKVKG